MAAALLGALTGCVGVNPTDGASVAANIRETAPTAGGARVVEGPLVLEQSLLIDNWLLRAERGPSADAVRIALVARLGMEPWVEKVRLNGAERPFEGSGKIFDQTIYSPSDCCRTDPYRWSEIYTIELTAADLAAGRNAPLRVEFIRPLSDEPERVLIVPVAYASAFADSVEAARP